MEEGESDQEYEFNRPMASSDSAASLTGLDEQQQEQSVPKSLETLELILQKILRSLSALADNFDRFLSSIEAQDDQVLSGLLKSAGRRGRRALPLRDQSPLLLFSIFTLILSFILFGLRASSQQPAIATEEQPEHRVPANRIQLPDGRNISYREQGVGADEARYSILVVHGFLSSRLAGIPGVNTSLLREFGVRLVAYDLPGFGESDVDPNRSYNSSAHDMENIADALGFGEQFWLLGFSEGGPHVWAAVRYIPQRLAGVAMVAPAGNPYGGNLTNDETNEIWRTWSFRRRLLHVTAKRFPSVLPGFIRRTVMNKVKRYKSLYASVRDKDRALLEQEEFMSLWEEDVRESIRQQRLVPLAQELVLLVNHWGFDLGDLGLTRPPVQGVWNRIRSLFLQENGELVGFKKPIHIWQGTEDVVVPAATNELVKRVLPHVHMHRLEGEGHMSWFYVCQECHRELLETLLGVPEGPVEAVPAMLQLSDERPVETQTESL